jgi:hypothetical protein
MPLASYEQGQALMEQAIRNLALDVSFKFLNKTYENDVYVREPVTGKKIRTACVRFRATSGFAFRTDPPRYSLTAQGLTLEENIAKLDANGLTFKFQLGPCADIAGGFGLKLRDVKFVYKMRPMLVFDDTGCKLSWSGAPEVANVAIGDLNVIGVQNDLDRLAKDAVREGLNLTLDNLLGSTLRNELARVVLGTCGSSKSRR